MIARLVNPTAVKERKEDIQLADQQWLNAHLQQKKEGPKQLAGKMVGEKSHDVVEIKLPEDVVK